MTFLYHVHVTYNYNCMVIRRGCWPAKLKMWIIAPRSSGLSRAKPVRRSSPIVPGNVETPPAYAPEFLQMQHAWPINAAGGLSYYARSRLRARWAQARACRAGARAWSGLPACPAITLACAQPLHAVRRQGQRS